MLSLESELHLHYSDYQTSYSTSTLDCLLSLYSYCLMVPIYNSCSLVLSSCLKWNIKSSRVINIKQHHQSKEACAVAASSESDKQICYKVITISVWCSVCYMTGKCKTISKSGNLRGSLVQRNKLMPRSLYRTDSLATVSKELSKYKLDLVRVQGVSQDSGDIKPPGK
jgi:hypothetical protein